MLTKIDNLNVFLQSGRHAAKELLNNLSRILVFENTTKGIKLCVQGVAIKSKYRILHHWPDDDPTVDESGVSDSLSLDNIIQEAETETETETELEDEEEIVDTKNQRHKITILDAAAMKVSLVGKMLSPLCTDEFCHLFLNLMILLLVDTMSWSKAHCHSKSECYSEIKIEFV